jgi:hypothetical protein
VKETGIKGSFALRLESDWYVQAGIDLTGSWTACKPELPADDEHMIIVSKERQGG